VTLFAGSAITLIVITRNVTSISTAAHSSYSPLNSVIASKEIKLNFALKSKTLSLIEKLANRKIGFTYMDMFTFAELELFIFYIKISSYFMLVYSTIYY